MIIISSNIKNNFSMYGIIFVFHKVYMRAHILNQTYLV